MYWFEMGRGKKREAKRGLEWSWRCSETGDRVKKWEEKRVNDEREKVEKGKKVTMDKWKEKGGYKKQEKHLK